MNTVLLTLHLLVTLALIGTVLIQRSEGGGLGIGSSQGMGSFMSGRGTANLLTRSTAILGTLFFVLSLALALLNRGTSGVSHDILADPPPVTQTAPAQPTPAAPSTTRSAPVAPAAPGGGAPATNTPATNTPATGTPATSTPANTGSANQAPTVPTH